MTKNITVKITNSKETVEILNINTAGTDAVRIKAQNGVNYEFVDTDSKYAPENIMIQRSGNDLLIAFEGSNINEPDLIIEDYYNQSGTNLLIGLHENGSYYAYIPESAQKADAVTMLADKMSAGQALGGEAMVVGAKFNPAWLLASLLLAGAGGGGGSGSSDGSGKNNQTSQAQVTGVEFKDWQRMAT